MCHWNAVLHSTIANGFKRKGETRAALTESKYIFMLWRIVFRFEYNDRDTDIFHESFYRIAHCKAALYIVFVCFEKFYAQTYVCRKSSLVDIGYELIWSSIIKFHLALLPYCRVILSVLVLFIIHTRYDVCIRITSHVQHNMNFVVTAFSRL